MIFIFVKTEKNPKNNTSIFSKIFTVHLCWLNFVILQAMTNEIGKPKGFGFVSFEEHEAALKVSNFVYEMNFHSCCLIPDFILSFLMSRSMIVKRQS